jgi:signal transduction histidine kinase/ABC-type branched-subunit amino acid transport system ATPase component
MSAISSPRLEMRGITVHYGSVLALEDVDFDLYPAEVHALAGEHRAGKSTLVKLLSGAVKKDGGLIVLNGSPVDGFTPGTSMRHRIGMVYQEMNVVPTLNAIENIFAGQTPVKSFGRINREWMIQEAKRLFARLKVDINLEAPLFKLSMAEQLMVELARLLSIDPEILIFDEISSKLTPVEMERVYSILSEVKEKSKSVIYISHDMDEIFRVADRVTILKDGRRRGTEEIKDLDRMKLIKMTYSFVLSREELEQDNKELFFRKRYNENIIKNLPVGVIILDNQNRLYLINNPARKILDLEENIAADSYVTALFLRHELQEYDDIVRCIERHEEGTWDEVKYGADKTLKISTFPFKDEEDKFLGTIVLMEDISKSLLFNEYLRRAEKIASTAELAAGVAHEINNPLGIVLNYTTIIRRKGLANADGMEKVRIIENELLRIKEIISSLLSFSRIESSEMATVDIVEILHEVVVLINHKIREKEIELCLSNRCGRPMVHGNANRLKQVFINLLMNGIEAVARRGRIAIAVRTDGNPPSVEIRFKDNGCGIADSIKDRIFDPFFSTKLDNKNTGLGLSISQHIIETHNGVIEVSTEGDTEFTVRLPLLK